ncbi:LysR family transcriptional regulator [Pseudodonghicola flavimaris]|uniref:LysR family transcriptional regulator n=1 Tax=Pseudodonghicola flavimaris TaxID=3050036 RepID=A0ABT7F1R9_9RHOB|nr:LysR family transcriptional regulator [Pseudodonghicola flavimaris]MDK3018553.1 LysR family transcriptional regulator [Pseudodonghicola flavimaris]
MSGLRRKLPSANALFVFEAAARHENFSHAADELNVTQPAVSRTIAALETHLGIALFRRGKAGAHLTAEGQQLCHVVTGAFENIGAELDALASRRDGKVALTLSVSTAFTAHWLMPRIERVRAAFPNVDLRFQLIPGPVDGPSDGVDLAMRYLTRDPGDALFIMREAHIPVCIPALRDSAARGEATRILLDPEGSAARGERSLHFADYAIVLQGAMIGQGVAEGWLNVVAHWLREGHLCPCDETLTVTTRDCYLLNHAPPERRGVTAALADWLRSELHTDLALLDAAYPQLGILHLCTPRTAPDIGPTA